jgi:hypothetical protein
VSDDTPYVTASSAGQEFLNYCGCATEGLPGGAARTASSGGPKAGFKAQVSLLPFSFSFMFYFLFYFIPNYFESNLNLNMSFSFEPIIQIQTLM